MFPWLTHNELVREVNMIKAKTTQGCTIGEKQVSFPNGARGKESA
jgi:hypothetical protein